VEPTTLKAPEKNRNIKLVAVDSVTIEQVKSAVSKAASDSDCKAEMELVSRNRSTHSSTFRARITGIREDKYDRLLLPESWPTGVKICDWRGSWRPLQKRDKIKVFVGNLDKTLPDFRVQQHLRQIYMNAGFSIEDMSAEKFVGKRQTSSIPKCLNLIVSIKTKTAGVTMEPIWNAIAENKIPPNVFIRQWVVHDEVRDKKTANWTCMP